MQILNKELYIAKVKDFTLSKSKLLRLWDIITSPIALVQACKKRNEAHPPGPKGHFLLGVLPELSARPLYFFQSLWHTYGRTEGICRFKLANKTIYLITDRELCQVITQDAETYIRGRWFDKNRQIIGDSLLTAEGEIWKKKRKEITPHLSVKAIKEHHYPIIKEVCKNTIQRWYGRLRVGEGCVDVFEEVSKCTIEVISRSLLGVDLSRDLQEGRRALDVILEHIFANIISVLPPAVTSRLPTKANRRYKQAVASAKRELLKSIKQQQAEGASNYLMERFAEEGELTQELFNDILNVFLAGFETTAQLLMWTIYELARRPEVHEKLCAEVQRVVQGEVATMDEIFDMPYLANVLQEVLRIYPPAALSVRDVTKDTTLGKYQLRKGDSVFVGLAMMGLDANRWQNPFEFNPDRFTSELFYKTSQYDLIPFGFGHHRCVGQQLSLVEAKIIIASIVTKFNFKLVACVDPIMRGTLHAEKPINVVLSPRHSQEVVEAESITEMPQESEAALSRCPFHRFFAKK
jgi:cytochrome P450